MIRIYKIVFGALMEPIRWLRKDPFHYLSAPPHILPDAKVRNALSLGHILPTMIGAVAIGVFIIPLLSESYAQSLENNEPIITQTVVAALLPMALISGFFVEVFLESSNKAYKAGKKMSREEALSFRKSKQGQQELKEEIRTVNGEDLF
ncbi:MAG: hypothetical protein AAFR61_07770 [Bacteroidota bacterium]